MASICRSISGEGSIANGSGVGVLVGVEEEVGWGDGVRVGGGDGVLLGDGKGVAVESEGTAVVGSNERAVAESEGSGEAEALREVGGVSVSRPMRLHAATRIKSESMANGAKVRFKRVLP
jgi:hypothetical protein